MWLYCYNRNLEKEEFLPFVLTSFFLIPICHNVHFFLFWWGTFHHAPLGYATGKIMSCSWPFQSLCVLRVRLRMMMMTVTMAMVMMLVMLQECHHNILQYEFPSAGLCLSSVFAIMEEACRDLPIDDYSISQNTLDNVRLCCLSVSLSCWIAFFLAVLQTAITSINCKNLECYNKV